MSEIKPSSSPYKKLVQNLKQVITQTGTRIYRVVETEKAGMYWRMGRHIQVHLLEYGQRAEYGKKLFSRLSSEINIEESLLHRMVKFYNAFPNLAAQPELTWNHYKALLPVKDREKRFAYIEEIREKGLSSRELKILIAGEKIPDASDRDSMQEKKELKCIRGVPFVYRIKQIDYLKTRKSRLVVDCGFNIFTGVNITNIENFTPNQTARVVKEKDIYTLFKADIPVNKIYTYKAYVEKVLDGDTVWVTIDLGFKIFTRQKLRLYKLDAPPLETVQGKTTMKYLKSRFESLEFIVVKTHWRDKFDRYLADIFYSPGEKNFLRVTAGGKYLNQELAEGGYCRIVSG